VPVEQRPEELDVGRVEAVHELRAELVERSRTRVSGSSPSISAPIRSASTWSSEAAQQAGHAAETCLRYYAHLFAEFDPARRVSAEEEIRKARAELGGRSEDAGGRDAEAA
jgi:hypothetical protein